MDEMGHIQNSRNGILCSKVNDAIRPNIPMIHVKTERLSLCEDF